MATSEKGRPLYGRLKNAATMGSIASRSPFFDLIQTHYRQGANRIVTTDEFLSLLSQYGDREAIEPIVAAFFSRP